MSRRDSGDQDALQMARGRASPAGAPTVLDHPGLGRRLGSTPRSPWPASVFGEPWPGRPTGSSLRFGYSTVAQGFRAQRDAAVVLTPPGTVESDPFISPRQVRTFVRRVAPGHPPNPVPVPWLRSRRRWLSSTTGDPLIDAAGALTCGPYLSVDAVGRLSLRTRSIHRPPIRGCSPLRGPALGLRAPLDGSGP